MQNTQCPVCDSDVVIEDEAYEGDLLDCANCGAELEITSLRPLTINEVKQEDENDGLDDNLDDPENYD